MPLGDTDAKLLELIEVLVINGSMCVSPGAIGGTEVPSSPVIYDQQGANLTSVTAQTPGAARVEVWSSINKADPVTPGDFENGYSNIFWHFAGFWDVKEPGMNPAPEFVLRAARTARYLKLDRTHGTVTNFHTYGA